MSTGCDCCEGVGPLVPEPVENRPSLPAIRYRVGTHATFRATLLAGLSSSARPALRALTAREDDFSVALLDAWAAVGDVLTFYQERIANESYLRTATERLSVLELARAVGYELAPGVASSTELAFALEDVPGAPEQVTIPVGTRVQSVPGPDERPQTFETVEAVVARPEWNELRVPLRRPGRIPANATRVTLAGVGTGLRPGDVLAVVGGGGWEVRTLAAVAEDREGGRTTVSWEDALTVDHSSAQPADAPRLYAFRQLAALFGAGAPDWRQIPLIVQAQYAGVTLTYVGGVPQVPADFPTQWPGFAVRVTTPNARRPAEKAIELDATYPGLVPGSWLYLADGDTRELYRVRSVATVSRADFALTARVTQVTLDHATSLSAFDLRSTVAWMQTEELPLADEGVTDPVTGREVVLDRPVRAPEPGRRVLVTGLPAPADDGGRGISPGGRCWKQRRLRDLPRAAPELQQSGLRELAAPAPAPEEEPRVAGEVAVLASTRKDEAGRTVLVFAEELRNRYLPATVRIHANLAPATHGEAAAERLGSGDAGTAYQRFALRQAPVTYTPAATPSGAATTLEVRVDGLLWREVATLHGQEPRDRVYTTRQREDGGRVVQFGDGRAGARLPTGRENVEARYRKGLGREGNVRAGQLTLLLTRPLGVRSVGNPLHAGGGADPEPLHTARGVAPRTVTTLERVVSLRDYEDFARGRAGIAGAHAVWSWDHGERGVLLTIAGPGGEVPAQDGAVARALAEALAAAGDPHVPVRVLPYEPVRFRVQAHVRREPDRADERVLAGVEAALRERFSFAARAFGQAVHLSEVVAAIQGVPGVAGVDVDALYAEGDPARLESSLMAWAPPAGVDADGACPAELLTVDLHPGDLRVSA